MIFCVLWLSMRITWICTSISVGGKRGRSILRRRRFGECWLICWGRWRSCIRGRSCIEISSVRMCFWCRILRRSWGIWTCRSWCRMECWRLRRVRRIMRVRRCGMIRRMIVRAMCGRWDVWFMRWRVLCRRLKGIRWMRYTEMLWLGSTPLFQKYTLKNFLMWSQWCFRLSLKSERGSKRFWTVILWLRRLRSLIWKWRKWMWVPLLLGWIELIKCGYLSQLISILKTDLLKEWMNQSLRKKNFKTLKSHFRFATLQADKWISEIFHESVIQSHTILLIFVTSVSNLDTKMSTEANRFRFRIFETVILECPVNHETSLLILENKSLRISTECSNSNMKNKQVRKILLLIWSLKMWWYMWNRKQGYKI